MVVEVKAMDPKKSQTALHSKETAAHKKVKAAEFVGEIKAELKRITWTSPEELKSYTKIVVGATFFCGMGIYIMDLIIQAGLWLLESTLRLII